MQDNRRELPGLPQIHWLYKIRQQVDIVKLSSILKVSWQSRDDKTELIFSLTTLQPLTSNKIHIICDVNDFNPQFNHTNPPLDSFIRSLQKHHKRQRRRTQNKLQTTFRHPVLCKVQQLKTPNRRKQAKDCVRHSVMNRELLQMLRITSQNRNKVNRRYYFLKKTIFENPTINGFHQGC